MRVDHNGHISTFILERDFNLHTRKQLESYLDDTTTELHLDLSNCKLVDSEAIIFLHRWMKRGNKLQIRNAPPVLKRIVQTLKIEDALGWPEIINEFNHTQEVNNERPT